MGEFWDKVREIKVAIPAPAITDWRFVVVFLSKFSLAFVGKAFWKEYEAKFNYPFV